MSKGSSGSGGGAAAATVGEEGHKNCYKWSENQTTITSLLQQRDSTFKYSHMLTKLFIAGHLQPNRVWRHSGVKSLKDGCVRGNHEAIVLADIELTECMR